MNAAPKPKAKPENPFLSLLFNLVIPFAVLTKASSPEYLGPVYGLVAALAFPIGYGCYDFYRRRSANFISILGFVSILLTGALGLFKVGIFWFAVKEAAVPALIGTALLVSMRTKKPLVRAMLYNDNLVQVDKIEQALEEHGAKERFDTLITKSSYLVALSFAISAVINFVLAIWMLKSPPGTTAFNEELGYMNAVSLPVILVSCTSLVVYALWKLIKELKAMTGLELESILKEQ